MAGRGPAPKDPKIRQRRNKASTRAVAPPPKAAAGESKRAKSQTPPVAPSALSTTRELPMRKEPWHHLTVQWWAAIWDPARNPFVDQYLETDILGPLYRLAYLVDLFWTTGDLDTEREIRLLEQRLVLDPLARRSAQWEIDPSARSRATPAEPPAPPKAVDDPRRKVLQMVKPA